MRKKATLHEEMEQIQKIKEEEKAKRKLIRKNRDEAIKEIEASEKAALSEIEKIGNERINIIKDQFSEIDKMMNEKEDA